MPKSTSNMQLPPPLGRDAALFLDFDGTLVGLAPTPEAIEIPPALVSLLSDLSDQLGGALAVVSGRQIDSIDRFLAPLRLPAAGEHGVQRRDATGHTQEQRAPDLAPILEIANELARVHEGLLVERKHAAIALHYRLAPQLEAVCQDAMSRAIANNPQLELMHGKFVFEVKPAGVNKGIAIDAFMLGIIGNCAVQRADRRARRIVWCCLPRFDGDPVFNGLLDPARTAACGPSSWRTSSAASTSTSPTPRCCARACTTAGPGHRDHRLRAALLEPRPHLPAADDGAPRARCWAARRACGCCCARASTGAASQAAVTQRQHPHPLRRRQQTLRVNTDAPISTSCRRPSSSSTGR
jgi:trehalose-phosphatase